MKLKINHEIKSERFIRCEMYSIDLLILFHFNFLSVGFYIFEGINIQIRSKGPRSIFFFIIRSGFDGPFRVHAAKDELPQSVVRFHVIRYFQRLTQLVCGPMAKEA